MKNVQQLSIMLNRGNVSDSVSKDDVEKAIKTLVGSDPRTIRQYTRLLEKCHVIFWVQKHGHYSLDAVSAIEDFKADVYKWLLGAKLE